MRKGYPISEPRRTRLMILGSGGGPALHDNASRMGPASLLVVDNEPYLVDCGEGVARQCVKAGIDLAAVNNIFVTHQHFDHNCDLGHFLAYSWVAGRCRPVHVWGPPPLEQLLKGYALAFSDAFRLLELEGGRCPFEDVLVLHEIPMDGDVLLNGHSLMSDQRVAVETRSVIHGDIPALAFRFNTADRDIVFSGDRGGQEDLAAFAADADVLVHEVIHHATVERILRERGAPRELVHHMRNNHTSPAKVGKTATAARVKTLVLNHVVPGGLVTDDEWIALVSDYFDGEIIVGSDMLEV